MLYQIKIFKMAAELCNRVLHMVVKTFTASHPPAFSSLIGICHLLQPLFYLICVEVHPLPPTPTLLVHPHHYSVSTKMSFTLGSRLYSTTVYFFHIVFTSLSSVATFHRVPFMAPHLALTDPVISLIALSSCTCPQPSSLTLLVLPSTVASPPPSLWVLCQTLSPGRRTP